MVEYKKFELANYNGEVIEKTIRVLPWKLKSGNYEVTEIGNCDAIALPRFNNKYGHVAASKHEAIQIGRMLGCVFGITVSNTGDFWNLWRVKPAFISVEHIYRSYSQSGTTISTVLN